MKQYCMVDSIKYMKYVKLRNRNTEQIGVEFVRTAVSARHPPKQCVVKIRLLQQHDVTGKVLLT